MVTGAGVGAQGDAGRWAHALQYETGPSWGPGGRTATVVNYTVLQTWRWLGQRTLCDLITHKTRELLGVTGPRCPPRRWPLRSVSACWDITLCTSKSRCLCQVHLSKAGRNRQHRRTPGIGAGVGDTQILMGFEVQ